MSAKPVSGLTSRIVDDPFYSTLDWTFSVTETLAINTIESQ